MVPSQDGTSLYVYTCVLFNKIENGTLKDAFEYFFSCQLSRTQSGTSVGSGKKDSVLSAEVS